MKTDNIKKTREAKEEIRMLAYELIKKRSHSKEEIMKLLGISESLYYKLRKKIER